MILPRGIRQKDAWNYLGVGKDFFLKKIKPKLHPEKFGKKLVVFDRLELDAWFDQYVGRHRASQENLWDNQNSPRALAGEKGPTGRTTKTSTSRYNTVDTALEKAREQMMLKRRKGGSDKDSMK